MQKNSFTKIIWILFYILVFVFLLKNSYNYLDPDLGWHLKVGEQILTEKQVPDINYYNYTLNGQKWVDHEWLSNAIMFWLYDNFGYLSLNLFFAFIVLLILIIQNVFIQKYFLTPHLLGGDYLKHTTENNNIKSKNRLKGAGFIAIFQLLGLFAIAPHIGVRVQEITLLNLLLLLIIIYHYQKNKNYKILFWLPFLFYFWACLHAGFLIGLFVLFFWISAKLVELIIHKYKSWQFIDFNSILNLKQIKIFSFFAALSILATCLTPYGLKLYLFLSDYKNTYYLKHIQEWLPIHYLPIMLWQLLYSAIAATVIILLIIFSFKKNKGEGEATQCLARHWVAQIAISLLFLFLAFKSKRHFPLLFIVSFPMIITFFSSYLYLPRPTDLAGQKLGRGKPKIFDQNWKKPLIFIKSYLIIGLLILIYTYSISINFISDPFSCFCHSFPCEATKFLKENKQYHDLNIFNNYGWGGYLLWAWPEKQLFIDGRLPITEFAGHTLFEEYHEFFKEEKVEAKLSQYNIKLVLLKIDKPYKLNWFEKYLLQLNEDKINDKKNYLKDYLEDSSGWQKVYSDEISKVYVEK
ncbi:hypothetical protein KAU19_01945 [Candidatus Parcubacteria bacterium]|nr:hypothetical protein [Candidatus Parcubacteria bacterium]